VFKAALRNQRRRACRQPYLLRRAEQTASTRSQVDVELYTHLQQSGLDFIQFAFRWMNCLLMRTRTHARAHARQNAFRKLCTGRSIFCAGLRVCNADGGEMQRTQRDHRQALHGCSLAAFIAGEVALPNAIRLWDTYLADGPRLHPLCSLAQQCRGTNRREFRAPWHTAMSAPLPSLPLIRSAPHVSSCEMRAACCGEPHEGDALPSFHAYVCAAFLHGFRSSLIGLDFQDLLLLLQANRCMAAHAAAPTRQHPRGAMPRSCGMAASRQCRGCAAGTHALTPIHGFARTCPHTSRAQPHTPHARLPAHRTHARKCTCARDDAARAPLAARSRLSYGISNRDPACLRTTVTVPSLLAPGGILS
jgi:hypothetical protein